MPHNLPILTTFAHTLADTSGEVINKYYRNFGAIDAKGDLSPVTIADRETEEAIRRMIKQHYPEHGIQGEEFGIENENAPYRWVIDPIDGTASFMIGRPIFGTLISLVHEDKSIIGIIDQPVTGERWVGVKGKKTQFFQKEVRSKKLEVRSGGKADGGATNGRSGVIPPTLGSYKTNELHEQLVGGITPDLPSFDAPTLISTRACHRLSDAVLATTGPQYFKGDKLHKFNDIVSKARYVVYGGDCYNFGLLSMGLVDNIIESGLKQHDFMALCVIVEGAGGMATDWQGKPLTMQSNGDVVFTGCRELHEEILKILNLINNLQSSIFNFMTELRIIGGGLAGTEAAWQAARRGVRVVIYEMRTPKRQTEAHKTDTLAELVCSNSFRSDDHTNSAIGLLHEEMRRMGSLIMACGDKHKVPAGGALAVDREAFSAEVQAAITSHPNIRIVRGEIVEVPEDKKPTIIATGPLTSEPLSKSILKATGEEYMAFFDAIAPIVYKDSVDFSKAWFQSRYDKPGPGGTGKDYINCPMTKDQYFAFIETLLKAEKTDFKEWEKNTPYFEGCLPIEVMAERGVETLRYGPMKPVGLTNPHSPEKPYAVVQLRQDNKLGTLYNIVGFQTKLKYGVQTEIFRMIPGLENAEFARLGGIHRNTFIKSPVLLDNTLRLKNRPNIRFAGQVTGVEGYVESASCGLMAGMFAADEILGNEFKLPPRTTALGSLLAHVTGEAEAETFQPMNINFGLMPPLAGKIKKTDRKGAYCKRALEDLEGWLNTL